MYKSKKREKINSNQRHNWRKCFSVEIFKIRWADWKNLPIDDAFRFILWRSKWKDKRKIPRDVDLSPNRALASDEAPWSLLLKGLKIYRKERFSVNSYVVLPLAWQLAEQLPPKISCLSTDLPETQWWGRKSDICTNRNTVPSSPTPFPLPTPSLELPPST